MTEQNTPTRIEWKFDDSSGRTFQRFSRRLGYEVWLIGRETPVLTEHFSRVAGNHILDGGQHRPLKHVALQFEFQPGEHEQAEAIIERGRREGITLGLIGELWLAGKQPEPFAYHVGDKDAERIADAVADEIDRRRAVREGYSKR